MAMTRHRGDPSDAVLTLSIRDVVILALTAVVAAGATRLIVLPVSVIDWDESVYPPQHFIPISPIHRARRNQELGKASDGR